MVFRGYSMPDEIYFLCLLHNVGATSSDKSLTLEEISKWAVMDAEKVRENLEKLITTNYVHVDFREGAKRYHVTVNGIRKVLSMYS
jgi:DNA-binding transcriptional regulator GbsR (MarR family)